MSEFRQDRFDDLVLYIAHKTKADPMFGRTKLAKVLFYADFDAYRDEGESITGATYIRMPFGPFPEPLTDAEERLEGDGRVRLAYDVEELEEKKIIPLGPPSDLSGVYEPWQLVLVDLWIKDISSATATRISDLSHEHAGWILAREVGAEIPYRSAYAPTQEPPDEAVELGRRLAREHQWS